MNFRNYYSGELALIEEFKCWLPPIWAGTWWLRSGFPWWFKLALP